MALGRASFQITFFTLIGPALLIFQNPHRLPAGAGRDAPFPLAKKAARQEAI